LDECLQNFKAPEQLGDGYKCDKCGDVNTTSTTIDVWRLPDILVIHVKRFVYTMYVRGKLNNPMEYPVHNLDMSRVLGRALDGDELDRTLYDLYGVVHHLGTMGGGHYVATCQPPSSGNGDQEAPWFSFNDSRVHEVTDSEIVSSSGYLLFYRRQRLSAHNIINLNPPS
jgi:ubiquitin carboxyl-terminal hydrolase 4/11/15